MAESSDKALQHWQSQWRSVKYEEVYLKDYNSVWEAEDSLSDYFRFYCHRRIHQGLGYRTPAEVHFEAT